MSSRRSARVPPDNLMRRGRPCSPGPAGWQSPGPLTDCDARRYLTGNHRRYPSGRHGRSRARPRSNPCPGTAETPAGEPGSIHPLFGQPEVSPRANASTLVSPPVRSRGLSDGKTYPHRLRLVARTGQAEDQITSWPPLTDFSFGCSSYTAAVDAATFLALASTAALLINVDRQAGRRLFPGAGHGDSARVLSVTLPGRR